METNKIYCGDCTEVMVNHIPKESVDMIYVDPPFFSERHYAVIWGDSYEKRAFEDRWKAGKGAGGIKNYIAWMEPKIRECHRVLKKTGTMWLHCDWHANAHLRILMDSIFGESNLINEIVWKRHSVHSDTKQGAKHMGRIHDTILLYSKSKDYKWIPQYEPYPDEYLEKTYRHIDKTGRRYKASDLSAAKPGGDTYYRWKGKHPPKGRYWAYSKENMEGLDKEGRIHYSKSGKPYLKQYLDEMPGVMLQDFWDDIKPIGSKERLGYPTQKPEALLDRIVQLTSDTTDVVLDPMCGCGTTVVVAQKLKRRWIGIDISPTACKLMVKRLRRIKAKISETDIIGLPRTLGEIKKMAPFEFQNWVCEKLLARVSKKKVGDMGIDGWLIDGRPLQVKQSERVGRNVIDNFETAMRRMNKKRGIIVALSFGKGAIGEVARAKVDEGLEIELKTVENILEEE